MNLRKLFEMQRELDGRIEKQHPRQEGEMLGYTWNEVEEAYMQKNAINHQRQDGGY